MGEILKDPYFSFLLASGDSSTADVGSMPEDESFRFMAIFILELQLVDDDA